MDNASLSDAVNAYVLVFQPLHYFVDKNSGRYVSMLQKNEIIKHSRDLTHLPYLQQRRIHEATLFIGGRTPEGEYVLVEVVGLPTVLTVQLPPIHRVECPYPSNVEPTDELRAERATLARQAWDL